MLWIGSDPSLPLRPAARLRQAIDEPHAGSHQRQQVRAAQPASPPLRHVQQPPQLAPERPEAAGMDLDDAVAGDHVGHEAVDGPARSVAPAAPA